MYGYGSPIPPNLVPGPGAYAHEQAETQTKPRAPAWELG